MKFKFQLSTGLLLFIALVILWLPWLGETLFYSKGEPREAIVAFTMLQSGDWILPVSGGEIPYKPPFLAWLIAALAWLLNGGVVNEFISRLPSVISAIILVMTSYSWARRHRGERFALLMSMILATSFEVFRAATACRVDMVLTACMVGAMYVIFDIHTRPGRRTPLRYIAAILLLSCAVLTKGPIGALLPGLVMGIYLLLSGQRFFPTFFKMLAIVAASFAIPAVWYYAAWLQGGDNFLQLVYEENVLRLTGKMSYESHVQPFWYNFITLITGMLPWTLLALASLPLVRRFKRRITHPTALLAIVAATTVTLFYCIPASKRSVYLLPAYPFIAYGIAALAQALDGTRIKLYYSRFFTLLGYLVPLIIIFTIFVPIAGYSFSGKVWAYALLLLPAIAAQAYWVKSQNKDSLSAAVIITAALLTTYGGAIMPWVLNRNSDKPLAAEISQMAGDNRIVAVGLRTYALNYYLDDRIEFLKDPAEAATLPQGTLLIISQPQDTLALPAHYRITPLTKRLSDTRHPAWVTTVINNPCVSDSVETTPSEPADAAQKSPR